MSERLRCSDTGKYPQKECYILIPACFGGGSVKKEITNTCSSFFIREAYEMVAEWNRRYLSKRYLYPEPDVRNYDTVSDWGNAHKRYERHFEMLMDYRNGTDDTEMERKYGPIWKLKIGWLIAGTDKRNRSLPFPIKIVEREKTYERVPSSYR